MESINKIIRKNEEYSWLPRLTIIERLEFRDGQLVRPRRPVQGHQAANPRPVSLSRARNQPRFRWKDVTDVNSKQRIPPIYRE